MKSADSQKEDDDNSDYCSLDHLDASAAASFAVDVDHAPQNAAVDTHVVGNAAFSSPG